MAINFPNSPTHGSTYNYGGVRYTYSKNGSDEGYWRVTTPGSTGVATSAEINTGTSPIKYVTPLELRGANAIVENSAPRLVLQETNGTSGKNESWIVHNSDVVEFQHRNGIGGYLSTMFKLVIDTISNGLDKMSVFGELYVSGDTEFDGQVYAGKVNYSSNQGPTGYWLGDLANWKMGMAIDSDSFGSPALALHGSSANGNIERAWEYRSGIQKFFTGNEDLVLTMGWSGDSTFTGTVEATNLSGNNHGDETKASIESKLTGTIGSHTHNSSDFTHNSLSGVSSLEHINWTNTNSNLVTTGQLTGGDVIAGGLGAGRVSMTINDGQGNANLAFNHHFGTPDSTGTSGRITTAVDSDNGTMSFQLGNNTTSGTNVNLNEIFELGVNAVHNREFAYFDEGFRSYDSGTINGDLTVDGSSSVGTHLSVGNSLQVDGRMYAMSSNDVGTNGLSGSLIVGGDGSGYHLALDTNEIMAKQNSNDPSTLNLNLEGGGVNMGGTLSVNGGSITLSSGQTVDGRDISADGSILDTRAPIHDPVFTNTISVDKIAGRSTEIRIGAGESLGHMTGTQEAVYLAGESGVVIQSSTNNLSSGLNNSAYICNSGGNSSLPGHLYMASGKQVDGRDVSADGAVLDTRAPIDGPNFTGRLQSSGEVLINMDTSNDVIYSDGHLELRTNNSGPASMGFHRGGYTACQLRHVNNGLILNGSSQNASADFELTGDIKLQTGKTIDGRDPSIDGIKLDSASEGSNPNVLVKRNGSGDIKARLFRSEYTNTNANVEYFVTQSGIGTNDNYLRPSTPEQARRKLGIFHGRVQGGGNYVGVSGFSVARVAAGRFRVTHNLGTYNYTAMATSAEAYNYDAIVWAQAYNYTDFVTRQTSSGSYNYADFNWSIILD
jgi:hypothetical protein